MFKLNAYACISYPIRFRTPSNASEEFYRLCSSTFAKLNVLGQRELRERALAITEMVLKATRGFGSVVA